MSQLYRDRTHAGQLLARKLGAYADRPDVIVIALPRGGVPVAYEVARRLHAPLDILLVRKLGAPDYEELAMGAVASGGVRVLNESVVRRLRIPASAIAEATADEEAEIRRREKLFRGDVPPLDIAGKVVILIDDGIATGATLLAAIEALRQKKPARIVVAVPVASPSAREDFAGKADEIILLLAPIDFFAVGQAYEAFDPVEDAEVERLLAAGRTGR